MKEGFYGLWYEQPAKTWTQALPLGNGRFGGMVYGGIQQERISLNEETVWAGGPVNRNNPKALSKLPEIRKAIFGGDFRLAEELSGDMLGVPMNLDSYQQLCSLDIRFSHTGKFRDYRRGLDIENALHSVQYRLEGGYVQYGHWYYRDTFVSAPDDLMVMYWHTDSEAGIDADICFSRFSTVKQRAQDNSLLLTGSCREDGIRFAALLQVTAVQGRVFCEGDTLKLRGAVKAELRLTGFTDYDGGDPVEKCLAALERAGDKSYETLKKRHREDYHRLYDRQHFSLGYSPSLLPADKLLAVYAREKREWGIFELWYNYLRYQLICSSRPGTFPSTLQGIWNDSLQAPWNSDFHPNVNLQVNYWPAEGYGLTECIEPLIRWIEKTVPFGEETAAIHYNAKGWVLHHVSDIFGCTTPMDGPWGIWPFGGAWLCRHLYEHYLYGGDRDYLKNTALPIIEGAVRFFLGFLTECPEGLWGEGLLVTCPSHSPENRFIAPDGQSSSLTYAASMDMEILYDLFTIYLDSLSLLELDSPLGKEAAAARSRLVPLQISKRTGCLQEWVYDYEEEDPGHRHVSHLYALYPGVQIGEAQKELLAACEASLERRLSHHYEGQGWSLSWIACLFARLHRGDKALAALNSIADGLTLENFFVDAHGSPQVGDAQGIAACIQEMLVQSQGKTIELLPALPQQWSSGVMKGLRIRGGHKIDLYWLEGRLVRGEFLAGWNTNILIKTTLTAVMEEDGTLLVQRTGDMEEGILALTVKEGRKYHFC